MKPFLLTLAGTLLAAGGGFAAGSRWLLPFLAAAPACAALWWALVYGSRTKAMALVALWAITLGAACSVAGYVGGARAGEMILNGPTYRDEMMTWIRTGQGQEEDPSLFLPRHAVSAALFAILSLATAGAAGLVMGAGLLAYMGYYVGEVARAGSVICPPIATAALAWNPWSIVRVASFTILGVVLAEPLLSRLRPLSVGAAGRRAWIVAGVAGLAADVLLKAVLAPHWRSLLASCLI